MSAGVLFSKVGIVNRRFLSNLSLSNQYVVEIRLPSSLQEFLIGQNYLPKGGDGLSYQDYGLLCAEVSLPGSTYATSEVKDNFMGVTQEFAHTRLYTDIDMTFYVDVKYRVLQYFQGWMDFISGGEGNRVAQASKDPGFYRRFRYPDKYKTTIDITKFERSYGLGGDQEKYVSRTYTLINAFPKSISAIPVAYGPAEILKMNVTFNYDRYTVLKEEYTSPPGRAPILSAPQPEGVSPPVVLDALGKPLVKPSWYKGSDADYRRDYFSQIPARKESAIPSGNTKPWQ